MSAEAYERIISAFLAYYYKNDPESVEHLLKTFFTWITQAEEKEL